MSGAGNKCDSSRCTEGCCSTASAQAGSDCGEDWSVAWEPVEEEESKGEDGMGETGAGMEQAVQERTVSENEATEEETTRIVNFTMESLDNKEAIFRSVDFYKAEAQRSILAGGRNVAVMRLTIPRLTWEMMAGPSVMQVSLPYWKG